MARVALAALATTFILPTAVIAAPPVAASVEISDHVVLPQSGHGDVVTLPGTDVLAVAGGDDSPVLLVDVGAGTVREVTGTSGVRSLDLDDDGSHLHGVSRTPDEIVEIGVVSGEVARRWPVPDACLLSDVVMRGGVLWVTQDCGFDTLRRLDPATGVVRDTDPAVPAHEVVGVPGASRFFTFRASTASLVTEQEVVAGRLSERQETGTSIPSVESELGLSQDGATVFVHEPPGPWVTGGTRAWDAASLAEGSESWDKDIEPSWSDGNVVGVHLRRTGVAALLHRDGLQVVNSFLVDDAPSMGTLDVRLVGDQLVVIANVGGAVGEKRLYVVDAPLAPEPQVTLDVPWGLTGIDTPTPVEGTVLLGGAPVAGQELELREVSPQPRLLGTVVTDGEGRWTTTWRPDQIGDVVLEVRRSEGRDLVARTRVGVLADYYRLDHTGPTEVGAGENIAVTFTATRNGEPVPDHALDVARHRRNQDGWTLEQTTSHRTDAAGQVTVGTTAGAAERYDFVATTRMPNGDPWQVHHSLAVLRATTVLTPEPIASPAVPGDPVELSVRLTTADGQPVAGQQVRFEVLREFVPARTLSATTDADGLATVVDTDEREGRFDVRYVFDGTVELDDVRHGYEAFERERIPTTVHVDGAVEGEVGTPVTVSGSVRPAQGDVEGPLDIRLTDRDTGAVTPATTDADGAWTAEVTPTLPGPNRWTVRFTGSVRLAPSEAAYVVSTPRTPTRFEDVVVTGAAYGEKAIVTGRLSGRTGPTRISIAWDDEQAITAYTAADGSFRAEIWSPPSPGTHTLRVAYEGDPSHVPTELRLDVDVAKGDPAVALSGPSWVSPGSDFSIRVSTDRYFTGTYDVEVVEPDGTSRLVPVTASGERAFSLPLTAPDTPGEQVEWRVTVPGDANWKPGTATFGATVRTPHDVAVTHEPSVPAAGEEVSVRVTVPGSPGARMSVSARDRYGQLVWSEVATVDEDGFTHSWTMQDGVVVTASVSTTTEHHATSLERVVRPRPGLTARLRRTEGTVGRYAIYPARRDPVVVSRQLPYAYCVRHIVQVRTQDGWETVRRKCAAHDDDLWLSRMWWLRDRDERYRVAALFPGDEWLRRTQSAWHYFRFS